MGMEKLRGNLLFGQSGGPTSVINASAAGVFLEALAHPDLIPRVYGMGHGIAGLLQGEIYDITQEDPEELEHLKSMPSSALGSCRYKLANWLEDDRDYQKILELLRRLDIRYFFYNGGNDSMDTCQKISAFLQKNDYPCRVVGIPKTIDNDLFGTDHCPGYASAARYVATTFMEVTQDARVYDTGMICVVEVMGRHAGWLVAASALATAKGSGPDLIYVPERPFDLARFKEDVRAVYERSGKVMIAVSEGVKTQDGKYIPELVSEVSQDAFGHKQLGGSAQVLANYLKREMGCKVRGIELSLMQRAASHLASAVDVEEAAGAGAFGVQQAIQGHTDFMVTLERISSRPYTANYGRLPLIQVANAERLLPNDWVNEAGNFVTEAFLDYAFPLIGRAHEIELEDGLPVYAKLKKILVKPSSDEGHDASDQN